MLVKIISQTNVRFKLENTLCTLINIIFIPKGEQIMKIIPEIKATFGNTYFLGYTEKKRYDAATKKRTEDIEGYICKIASSELREHVEVTVSPTVSVQDIAFNQKVTLKGVTIEPYAKSSVGTAFAQVIFRCTAEDILDESKGKSMPDRSAGQK